MAASMEAVGEWTNAQLRSKLSELGVKCLSKDKKDVLIERYLRAVREAQEKQSAVTVAEVPSTEFKTEAPQQSSAEITASRSEACALQEEPPEPIEKAEWSPGSDSLGRKASSPQSPSRKDKEKKVKKKDKEKDKKHKKDRHEKRTGESVRRGDSAEQHGIQTCAGKMETSWLSDEDLPAAPAAPCPGQEAPLTPDAVRADASLPEPGSQQAAATTLPSTPPVGTPATPEVKLPVVEQPLARCDGAGTPPVEPSSVHVEADCEGSPAKKAKRSLLPPSQDSTCAPTPSASVDPGTRSKDESTTQEDEVVASTDDGPSTERHAQDTQDDKWSTSWSGRSWGEGWSDHREKSNWHWQNDEWKKEADEKSWASEPWSSWDNKSSHDRSNDKWREGAWEGNTERGSSSWRESWESSPKDPVKVKDGHNLNQSSWEGSLAWSSGSKQCARWPAQPDWQGGKGGTQQKPWPDQKSSCEGSWPADPSHRSDSNAWMGEGKQHQHLGKGWKGAHFQQRVANCGKGVFGSKGAMWLGAAAAAAQARWGNAMAHSPVVNQTWMQALPGACAMSQQECEPSGMPQQVGPPSWGTSDVSHTPHVLGLPSTAAASVTAAVASTSPAQAKPQQGQEERADPTKVFEEHGFPQHIEQWQKWQDVIFKGWPPLPQGWVRCFSKSQMKVYFTRLVDMHSTFEESDVHNPPPVRSA